MSDPTPPVSSTYELLHPVEVFVVRPPRRRYWINIVLLVATAFSTILVGARLEYSFRNNLPTSEMALFPLRWAFSQPSNLLLGLPFAATLMLILMVHEMGHYLCCRYYGVQATLPFFIPAPTLFGTMGAFIRIRSPFRSRSALFDIGIAGPLAGFVAATLALLIALCFSKPLVPSALDEDLRFGFPLIFQAAHWLLFKLGIAAAAYPLQQSYLHPTAMAAWVGMFATSLNLLPGGQLDGGHIVYAAFPRAHRWISRITVLLLVVAGWYWAGWLLWAVLLRISGMRHPQVPLYEGLTSGRRKLFLVALAILVLTFMLTPVYGPGTSLKDLLNELTQYLRS